MKRHADTYLYLAFLAILAVTLFACSVSPSQRVNSAQRELGAIGPQVEVLLRKYEQGVDAAIQRCEKLKLESRESREDCLGEFAPRSQLSESVSALKVYYDFSAEALRELELSLKVVETWLEE